jgi:hypothetical protein
LAHGNAERWQSHRLGRVTAVEVGQPHAGGESWGDRERDVGLADESDEPAHGAQAARQLIALTRHARLTDLRYPSPVLVRRASTTAVDT